MRTIEVVSLAGGRGSRMGELTSNAQKCMLEVEGKPLLGHLMDKLIEAFGSIDIKFGVCYQADQVIDYVTHNKPKNADVDFFYCVEGEGELGHFRRVKHLIKGGFICAPGDIVALPNVYQNAIDIYSRDKSDGVISLSPDLDVIDTHGVGKVVDGNVVDLLWPTPSVIAEGYFRDMTIWPGDQNFFKLMDTYVNVPRRGMSWVYIAALKDGRPLSGNVYRDPWLHMGYPGDMNKKIPR